MNIREQCGLLGVIPKDGFMDSHMLFHFALLTCFLADACVPSLVLMVLMVLIVLMEDLPFIMIISSTINSG